MTRSLPRSGISGLVFPGAPPPQGAALLAQQYQFAQTERWPPELLRAHQTCQIARLIAHAREHVPYWRDALAGLDLSAEALDAGAWQALPILERAQVQAHQADLLSATVPADHGARVAFSTSGATGRPLTGEWTQLMQFFWGAVNLRDHLWHARDFTAGFAAIRTQVTRATLPGWGPAIEAAYATGPAYTLPIHVPVHEQLAWLRAVRPGYLISHPSNLRGLLLETRHSDLPLTGLQGVISFGEMPGADLRALCRQQWQAPLADIYSCEEGGYLALECPAAPGTYHAQAETVRLEILDAQGRACATGQSGRVVITPLHNYAMPLLRYALGDHAVAGAPCPCGRTLPTLTRILGRSRNLLRLPDGTRHWPSFPATEWLAIAPVRQFQLRQRTPGAIHVQLVATRPLAAAERRALTAMLQDRLRHPFAIDIEQVADLPPPPNGKFEDFVCELPGA